MITKEMFMQGLPFTVKFKEGIFQYSEKTYGGELVFTKYRKCKYVMEIEEINENFVSCYFFEQEMIVRFKDCEFIK